MNLLSRDELEKLMKIQSEPCVSIFMPTAQAGKETQQNSIRFKNLLREAKERLLVNMRGTEVEKFLEPAQKLLNNSLFWQHQSNGLAVFLSQEVFSRYCLPLDFEGLTVVTDHFHIKPLLPLLRDDGRFYVLALSQNEVRLLHGTYYSVSEVELENVPESLAEALKYDDPERQLQLHTGTPGARGRRAAIFHGHGVGTDDDKNNILRYFRQINKGLHGLLKEERAPLVLAGVDYLLPIYREANTYSHLMEEGITGNPEGLSSEELHKQALAIVQPYFQQAKKDAIAQYKRFADTNRASCDIKEVVPAAYYGRVALFFVAVGVQCWGAFEQGTNRVHLHQEKEPGDEDLLDSAATQTILTGGTVYAIDPDDVPADAPLAAVFRY